MLQVLRIESFAIIDSLEIHFGPGLNVVTGETGAGKSILVDALELLLGGRADPEQVRSGREEAIVEGLWVQEGLGARARALGLPCEGDEVLVRRVVARRGRGRVYVNGALATVGLLSELTAGIVDLSGQHAHVALLQPERHLEVLDRFGGLQEARAAYGAAYEAWMRAARDRQRLLEEAEERLRRKDYLEFLLREIEELAPTPGEEEALLRERRLLGHAEKLALLASEAEGLLLAEEGCAVDALGRAAKRVEEAARLDPALETLAQRIQALQAEVQEAAREVAAHAARIEVDPERLRWLEERLEALQRLGRKHGGSLEVALSRCEEMRAELRAIEGAEQRLEELDAILASRQEEVARLAARLSEGRRRAAEALETRLRSCFQDLSLGKASLRMRFRRPEGAGVEGGSPFGPRGAEEGEFDFSANPGEEARPLARIASGGELSRVLLALKRALAEADPVACWIFDEIDTGIGGATALAVGRMLKEAGASRQVICITHLAQVAAHADRHLEVAKEEREGRNHSSVRHLEAAGQRQRALATMLAGDAQGAALGAAAELLERARGRAPRAGRGRGSRAASHAPARARVRPPRRRAGEKPLPAQGERG